MKCCALREDMNNNVIILPNDAWKFFNQDNYNKSLCYSCFKRKCDNYGFKNLAEQFSKDKIFTCKMEYDDYKRWKLVK